MENNRREFTVSLYKMTGQNDANKRFFRISHANILGYFGFIAFSFASGFCSSLAACLLCASQMAGDSFVELCIVGTGKERDSRAEKLDKEERKKGRRKERAGEKERGREAEREREREGQGGGRERVSKNS